MNKKKIVFILLCIIGLVCVNLLIFSTSRIKNDNSKVTFSAVVQSDTVDYYQFFYNSDMNFSDEQSTVVQASQDGNQQTIAVEFLKDYKVLRIDFGSYEGKINIYGAYLAVGTYKKEIDLQQLQTPLWSNDIGNIYYENGVLEIDSVGNDSNIVIDVDTQWVVDEAVKKDRKISFILDAILCVALDVLAVIFIFHREEFLALPREIMGNKRLIVTLAKNDFRTRFAGSYLGIIWAFIQPLITVVVYWFVFQVGLRAGKMSNYPFVVFLITGLVPWFFFSDALNGGTNALLEYNYLVKKVVFKISILPVVKVLSNMFVNLFFIVVAIVLSACYGFAPSIYTIQIIYYVFCTFIFVLGLAYLTSSIVAFFRDLTQIINIVLQVGMWMTPIMWDASLTLPPKLHFIFKLNPMYYIVNGYRNAILAREWFWNDMMWTVYFWIITIAIFMFGATIFRRLKVHFADVL
jgi:teichoic acid transport system permease protein